MTQEAQLHGLIDDLYAAPGTYEGWLLFLDNVCSALDGSGASFLSVGSDHRANVATTVRTDPGAVELYTEHWGAFDPWGRSPRLSAVGPLTAVTGDELISHTAVKDTAFYTDFGRRYDISRCVVGIVENGPRGVSVISVNGTEGRGAFNRADAGVLTSLMPHVRCSLQLHRRLVTANSLSHTLAYAIDFTQQAVILVSRTGKVVFMNRGARDLIAKRDGLNLDGDELRTAAATDTARLRATITAATFPARGPRTGGSLPIHRPSGRRALAAIVSPYSRQRLAHPDGKGAAAIVIVTDPDKTEVPSNDVLRTLFSLTPAEAKLTRAIVAGLSPAEAARTLDLRIETVRSRLKAIFEKTDVHSQTDLVCLVLTAIRGVDAVMPGGSRQP